MTQSLPPIVSRPTSRLRSCDISRVHRALRPVRWILVLAMVGCGATESATEVDSLAPVLAKLDATDARLATLETKLDTMVTKLEPISTWVTQQTQAEQQEEARRLERKAERAADLALRAAERKERVERRRALNPDWSVDDGGGDDGDDGDEVPPVGSSREIPGARDSIRCSETSEDHAKCEIDRAFLDELIGNPELLSRQARVVPSQRDGATAGYKLYGIRRGSLPKLLTIKNGDMLTAINGNAMTSIDEAMAIYTKLRRAKELNLDITRKGKPYDLDIVIKD